MASIHPLYAQPETHTAPNNFTPRSASNSAGNMHIEVLDLLPTEPEADEVQDGTMVAPAMDNPQEPTEILTGIDPNAPIDESNLPEPIKYNAVVLNGINKITARSEEVSGPVGTVLRFNNLEIISHDCQSIVDNGVQGFAALLEIWELKAGDTPNKILQGWMFSTSPSLFGLEHPLYDIGVQKCTHIDPEAETKEVSKATAQKAEKNKPANAKK